MKIGYARVSTKDQSLDRQIDRLKSAGCEMIFEEKESGMKSDRPELQRLYDHLRPDDIVVVTELTRLGRSSSDLISLVSKLNERKCEILSLQEPWMNTTTSQGKLVFTIFSGMAEFERNIISERTKDGLAAARARGRFGGRRKIDPEKIRDAVTLYESQKYTLSEIEKRTGVSRSTLYRNLEKHK